MAIQSNAALATVRAGGHEYSLVSQRTCRTCNSPYREQIERDTVSGRTWKAILRDLPEDTDLTPRNVADHFKNGHLPVAEEAVRQLAERNSEAIGELVTTAAPAVVDYLAFAQSLVGRLNDRLVRGEAEPDFKDALRAAELLARYGAPSGLDEPTVAAAFIVYHQTAELIMTPGQFEDFGQRLEKDPTLRALAEEWEQRAAAARARP